MFDYCQPTRIHFGAGRIREIGRICKRYGRVGFMVTTPDEPLRPLYEKIKGLLLEQGMETVHFDQVSPNPSVEMVQKGFEQLRESKASFVLGVGGGSSIDTAKTLAFTNGKDAIDWDELFCRYSSPYENYESYSDGVLPLISVPTTSGTGSQVTQAAVITRGKEKITFYHPQNFSRECILDPELMMTLPNRITASTGFDAFTHAFESYINPRASRYSEMDSMEAMRLVVENLPKVLKDPGNLEYRSNLAMADTLAGRALANSGAQAPHPLSEIIGGITHLPHGEALAVVFPAFIRHSIEANREKYEKAARIFCKEAKSAEELFELLVSFLKEIGLYQTMKEMEVDREAFEEMLQSPVLDVLPFGNRDELETILRESYE
ncbi:MAG: iron-containing alcohol dehydrogenase [Lachnospiraceae bacterium]|nr:iron-containing alcohol dehydrogenase [Lachnospiraceae bacterium]